MGEANQLEFKGALTRYLSLLSMSTLSTMVLTLLSLEEKVSIFIKLLFSSGISLDISESGLSNSDFLFNWRMLGGIVLVEFEGQPSCMCSYVP